MSQPITIGSVTLPASLEWVDEFGQGSDLVGQVETISVTGALIVQASAQQAGRVMTLKSGGSGNEFWGSVTRDQLQALKALADVAGATYAVTLNDGRSFNAMFRRQGSHAGPANAAVEATRQLFAEDFDAVDYYSVTINLILV